MNDTMMVVLDWKKPRHRKIVTQIMDELRCARDSHGSFPIELHEPAIAALQIAGAPIYRAPDTSPSQEPKGE